MGNIRVNDSGQITIPPVIIEELGITKGEEFKIVKRDNHFIMIPVTLDPLKEMQKICSGLAEEMGWETEDDIVKYCKEIRKELAEERRMSNADNA